MVPQISLVAQPRDTHMTPKALRRAQIIPAVVYGHAIAPTSVQCEYRAIERVLKAAGTSHLIALSIPGQDTQDVLVREVQRDPITGRILHVDFYAVVATEVLRNLVPIILQGRAPAVDKGGTVVQLLDELEIECLPKDMPAAIEVDISSLQDFHDHLTVADLKIPANVRVLSDPEAEVVSISAPHVIKEAEAEVTEAAAEATKEEGKEQGTPTGEKPAGRQAS